MHYLILNSPCSSFKPLRESCFNNKTERKNVIPDEKISDFSGLKIISLSYPLANFFNSGDI